MKAITNSEFAQFIANRFPKLHETSDGIYVFNEVGGCAIEVKESAKGYSVVRINGESYTKMKAADKLNAFEYVVNLPVEIVTTRYKIQGIESTYRSYYIEGAKMKKIENDKNRGYWWWEKALKEIESIEKIY